MSEAKPPNAVSTVLGSAETWLESVKGRQDPQTKLIRELAGALRWESGITKALLPYQERAVKAEADLTATRAAMVAALDEHEATRVLTFRIGELKDQLAGFRQFVQRERALRDAQGKGGQQVGNSPSISPSVLKELERILGDSQ